MKESKYDFFICHASEDKNDFVRPFAGRLVAKGYRVWYDEFSLTVGDSLMQAISEGIKNSYYGIIVLSKSFFEKKWTKKELEALFSKEIVKNYNLILPIWLELNVEDVYEFSPLLVDKVAVSVKSSEIDEAISAIEKKTKIDIITIETIKDKINYLVSCNSDRRGKYLLDLEKRIKSIFLYQQEFYNWYTSDDLFKDDEFDEDLVEDKRLELQSEYGIPRGVWTNPEPFPRHEIERAIKLCSKWVFRKMNFKEVHELHLLLDESLDTDIPYILYGFPHSSVRSGEKYQHICDGIWEIGIKDPAKRLVSYDEYKQIQEEVFDKYFGR